MQRTTLAALSLLAGAASADFWQPIAGTTWQIVLSEVLAPPYPDEITAIDGDLFSNNASTWSDLQNQGYKTICYFSAGSYEDWRPDANQFNKTTDIGAPLDGWPGEWWVNTKSDNVRRIMANRLDLAQSMGCDAVDPDNMDAYGNDGGGLGLTEDDAVDYVNYLAGEAHNRGMGMGLKNAGAIVTRVLDQVQFQINEQCNQYNECDSFQPFIDANKPVFGIEYTNQLTKSCPKKPDQCDPSPDADDVQAICNDPQSAGFSTVIKHMTLDGWVIECNATVNGTVVTANGTRVASNSTGRMSATTTTTPTPSSGIAGRSVQVGGFSALGAIAVAMALVI